MLCAFVVMLAACSSSSSFDATTDGGPEANDTVDPCIADLAQCPPTFTAAHTPNETLCPADGDALVTTAQCHGYQLLKHSEGTSVVWLCFYDKSADALLGWSDASGTGVFHTQCTPPGSLFTTPVGKVGDFDGACAYASICPGHGADAAID